jgi:3',5'-cyclic AMP phosphodiesterase CpdA
MASMVYWSADGAGVGVRKVQNTIIRWIRAHGSPALVVNGGDVYNDGKPNEFEAFFEQMDRDVTGMCETPGNHDWRTTERSGSAGTIAAGYEAFWGRFPPPLSRQPVDTSKRGGARYEHVIDLEGWRLVFIDTGPCKNDPWPMGDPDRIAWLRRVLTETPGRARIVFAHHSRLSNGKHGDVENVDTLWRTLFDERSGAPLAALTLAGHDHNVSVYGPRPRRNPKSGSVAFSNGIHVMVNGAGGRGHDTGFRGTRPDIFFDDDNFCLTRITLLDGRSADVEVLSFGHNDPPTVTTPSVLSTLRLRL